MGEVYRAYDERLDREVAIKILPRSSASDPERLARFEREARLLAALNHPHIGAIYGVEPVDGRPALVLELIAGETLAARIATGRLPLAEALTIARQIAEALEAAHERGIVHRDLKPANIRLTPEGVVKVLDFGLAKAAAEVGPVGPSGPATERHPLPEASLAPAGDPHGTREGAILGTLAYMSPEQAAGHAVDRRTDLWAFAVILLEMLTGRPVFAGDTMPDVLAAVLKSEPDWTTLPAETPALDSHVAPAVSGEGLHATAGFRHDCPDGDRRGARGRRSVFDSGAEARQRASWPRSPPLLFSR